MADPSKDTLLNFDLSGGINAQLDPALLAANEVQYIQNFEVREGRLVGSKGRTLYTPYEVGSQIYDRFPDVTTGINADKWSVGLGSPTITSAGKLRLVTPDAVISRSMVPQSKILSYIRVEVTTPATQGDSNFYLMLNTGVVDSNQGLAIHFSATGDIVVIVNGVSTDTGQNWAVSTTYTIMLQRASGPNWDLRISGGIFTNATLQNIVVTIPSNAVMILHASGGTTAWLCDDVIFHPGWTSSTRQAIISIYRFYQKSTNRPITLAFTDTYCFALDENDEQSWLVVKDNLTPNIRWDAAILNDRLFLTNKEDGLHEFIAPKYLVYIQNAPRFSYIAAHIRRLFGGIDNTVYISGFDAPTSWDLVNDFENIPSFSSDRIVRLKKLGNVLYIIKENTVWQMQGTTRQNIVTTRVHGAQGTIAPWSVAETGVSLIYLGRDDVYEFSGGQTKPIGYAIRTCLEGTNPHFNIYMQRASQFQGIWHAGKYRLACEAVSQTDQNVNNCELQCDFVASENGSWIVRTNVFVNCYVVFDGTEDRNQLIAGSSRIDGAIYQLEHGQTDIKDPWTPINMESTVSTSKTSKIISRLISADARYQQKDFRLVHNQYVPLVETSGKTFTFKYFTNEFPQGNSVTITADGAVNDLGGNMLLSTDLLGIIYDYKKKEKPLESASKKNKGEYFWYELQYTDVGTPLIYVGNDLQYHIATTR